MLLTILAAAALAIFGLGILGIEIYLIATHKATISERNWNLSKAYPPYAFAVGFLMGHLFWASGCAYKASQILLALAHIVGVR